MGIQRVHELARSSDFSIGERPTATRRWVCTLADTTLQNDALDERDVLTELGIAGWGALHPTWSSLKLRRLQINERFNDSPYHVEVVGEYGTISDAETETPTQRDPIWAFESYGANFPALYYYHGAGNNDVRALTNSAYDLFEGLVTDEAMVKASIKANVGEFPMAQVEATNTINGADYAGAPQYTWKVAGVSAVYTIEYFNDQTYRYWATSIDLLYRQTTWILQLPDVGWNFLNGSVKQRAMVFDEKNAEWVASASPVGLNSSGQQTFGLPALLQRRVNQVSDFTDLFGEPPD